ncbi:MAG: RsmG family class I SAM-dependent methyltransferase [Spirochaetota bacterium]
MYGSKKNYDRLRETGVFVWDKRQEKQLEEGLRELCGGKDTRFLQQLHKALSEYGRVLLEWHNTFHLLGPQNERDFVSLHLLDSISGALFLTAENLLVEKGPVQIVDVGSGLGLPGIPLALFFSHSLNEHNEFSFFLVEPASRRAKILRSIAAELRLSVQVCEFPVELWQQRVSLPQPAQRIVTCRAFRPLDKKDKKDKKSRRQLLQPLERADSNEMKTGVLLYKGPQGPQGPEAEVQVQVQAASAKAQHIFTLPQCGHQRSLFYIDDFSAW